LFRLLRPFHQDAPVGTTMTLAIQPFQVLGSGTDAWLGDSVAAAVREELAGFVDFFVPPVVSSYDSLAVLVTGTAEATGDRLRLTLTADPRRPAARLIADSLLGNKLDWRRLADSLAFRLVQNLFRQELADDHWLPRAAIPEGSLGLALWLQAEQFFSRANWDEASRAYRLAEQTDPSCYLCSFRLLDIGRWLDVEFDSTRIRRLEKAIDRFPRHYQSLIHAAAAQLPERLDTLKQAAGDYPGFFLVPFEYGDELFHRGPLYGISRSEARAQFEQALGLWPHFGPGWEHLAWLQLSEGDSASVAAALGSLNKSPATTGFSKSLRVMLLLGQVWKFSSVPSARETSRQVLRDPEIAANRDAAAGARLLMTTDAPLGAVEFGRMLAAAGWAARSDVVRGGLLGQLFGFAALGQLDSMRAVGTRLDGVTTDGSLPLLAWELEAVLRTFDPETAFRNDTGVTRALRTYASAGATEPVRHRAAWMLGLVAARAGDTAAATAVHRLLAGRPASERMLRILDATVRGAHRNPAHALAVLPPMPSIGVMPGRDEDPLEDAVVRLSKAEWQEQSGDTAGALSTLLWHEHLWVIGHLTGDPQPGELGWAVGTLARWHRVRLFGAATSVATRCADLKAIQRRWKDGQPPFAARADSAVALARGVCQ
jgi:tetratricopeptide (TPR) repeat protein